VGFSFNLISEARRKITSSCKFTLSFNCPLDMDVEACNGSFIRGKWREEIFHTMEKKKKKKRVSSKENQKFICENIKGNR